MIKSISSESGSSLKYFSSAKTEDFLKSLSISVNPSKNGKIGRENFLKFPILANNSNIDALTELVGSFINVLIFEIVFGSIFSIFNLFRFLIAAARIYLLE